MKQQIIDWFNGSRDYKEGFELFKQYSSKIKVIKVLSKGFTKFNAEKLTWELHKLAGLPESVCSAMPVTNGESVDISKKSLVKKELRKEKKAERVIAPKQDLPLIIQQLIREKGELQRKRAAAHMEMGEIEGNSPKAKTDRKQLKEEVEQCTKRLDEVTHIIAQYDSKGILPVDDSQKPIVNQNAGTGETEAELLKKRVNIRSRLSKARSSVENTKGAKQKEYKAKVIELETELAEVDAKLNEFKK